MDKGGAALDLANMLVYDEMYQKYLKDPSAVDTGWREVFFNLDREQPSANSTHIKLQGEHSVIYQAKPQVEGGEELRMHDLIQAYRTYGHLMANIDPLHKSPNEPPAELRIETYGLEKGDLSKEFPTLGLLPQEKAPLATILNTLKSIYCNRIGIEYMGLGNRELEQWLQQRIEPNRFTLDLKIEQKQEILKHLIKSELLETFLHMKYAGQKWFSLEGAETLTPMLATTLETGAKLGVEDFVLGMPHRGRVNILANIMNKPYTDIFHEFEDNYLAEAMEGGGDVKHHKGFFSKQVTATGHAITITMPPNPSHLESVDPVVEGQAKAKQIQKNDPKQEKVLPIQVHGDAAISGQGVVYETLQMYKLEGYSTGGTLHFVVNNQVGFTTAPEDTRSTYYCTDIAKVFAAPVFHVNAEDPESCVFATMLAVELRRKFHCEVFIDLVCYRKYGHNEGDEPAYTQPIDYQIIRKKESIREIYRNQLVQQGVVEKFMAQSMETEFKKMLQQALKASAVPDEGYAKEFKPNFEAGKPEKIQFDARGVPTAVSKDLLASVAKKAFAPSQKVKMHPKLENQIKERLSMVMEGSKPLDWGTAEILAYGTLLWEEAHVRISGQDSARGTFSQRHAVWIDQNDESRYSSLQHLKEGQGRFDIYNSLLSEYSVLGFEFGYSSSWPKALVVWEAQFGDFCNGAQIILDQYIASSDQKWSQKSNVVLFLPHGYEGQGPEHSSGRLERFLTSCARNNMEVANPTLPAQFFHLLRRQVYKPSPRPLIIFTPKGLLRHPQSTSSIDDLTGGSFREILDDGADPAAVTKLILCSGRIYFELAAERTKLKAKDMAIVRIEQLYPLDWDALKAIFEKYKNKRECFWVQDEPSNMGAWNFMRPILQELLEGSLEVQYRGRPASASPAVGSHNVHKKEQLAILQSVFTGYDMNLAKDETGIKS